MPTDMPQREILQYLRSGNFFVTCEGDDEVLTEEIELLGEDNIMFASDMPHPEMRDNAAEEIFENKELSDSQKRKILSDNVIRYYGEP